MVKESKETKEGKFTNNQSRPFRKSVHWKLYYIPVSKDVYAYNSLVHITERVF